MFRKTEKFIKITILFVITALLFVTLTGCSDSNEEVTKQDQEVSEDVTEESSKENQEDDQGEKEPEEKADSDIATRKKPASFGDTIEFMGTYYDTDIQIELTLSNLIRGEEAEKLALEMNQFNEWQEDEEPIIFDIDFELVKYSPEDDDPFFIDSSFNFRVFDSSYSQVNTDSYLTVDNSLTGNLYEGGSLFGKAGKIIPKGDRSYIVFEDLIWFQLPE